jgi:hypothetical protein
MSRPIDALLGNIDPLTGLRRGMVGGNASYMQRSLACLKWEIIFHLMKMLQ